MKPWYKDPWCAIPVALVTPLFLMLIVAIYGMVIQTIIREMGWHW